MEIQKSQTVTPTRSLPRWLRYSVVLLLILGVFFRFYNLDEKVFWLDEARTSLRMSGHTKTEFLQEAYTGKIIDLETLQQYQRPDDTRWADTIHALKGNAEHTPLYFLLARLWTELFGYSVGSIRSLSAMISLLGFPCLFWLCCLLFDPDKSTLDKSDLDNFGSDKKPYQNQAVAWVALGLMAISPLHVLYAQEARPYSLWTVLALASSASLLWALRGRNLPRRQSLRRWIAYGTLVALGLYTQLLFGLVVVAHALYVAIVEKQAGKWRWYLAARFYLLATGGAVLAFVPWLVLLLQNLEQVNEATSATTREFPFKYLLNQWFLNLNRVFINGELYSFNLVLVLLSVYALFFLCRHTPKRIGLFILTLTAVPFLALALPDILVGGERSLRIRYLIPSYLGIQIACAYLFAIQITWAKTWLQKFWRIALVILITGSLFACVINAQTQIGWSKSIRKSGYYPVAAGWINRADRPLVVSDAQEEDILSFSYELKPEVKFQLVEVPRQLKIPQGFDVFLLNPSRRLRNVLSRQGYPLLLLCQDEDENPGEPQDRLWLVRQRE
ncbi:DUF2723 domain-containing protein [Phormidium tenue FACHB-886]|nr:DUF2723 domain-containing protein [Phormidium tenue FACHB-886]